MSLSFDLSWRSPSLSRFTTSTHGSPNVPPGYAARACPEMATHQSGTMPRLSSAPVSTSITGIEPVRMAAAPSMTPVADPRAVGHDAARADHGVVADHHRRGLRRLEHAADPHTTGEVHPLTDLRARPDRRPGVDHGVGADARTDVDVARHHHRARREVGTPAGRCSGNDAHAVALEVALQGDLVGVLERPELDGGHVRQAEQQQHRVLQPLVDDDLVVDQLRHPRLAGVEQLDRLRARPRAPATPASPRRGRRAPPTVP